jgi:tetratricopeptide (TPR) repeat protein
MGLIAVCLPAHAAVQVFGNAPAGECYHAAEFGIDPQTGIGVCTDALQLTNLTPHDSAATMINRSILRTRAGDDAGAISDCTRGLSIDPNIAEGYVDRGVAEILLKDWSTALADINKGIDMNTDKLEFAYYDRAIVEESTGNIRAAYEDYSKALQLRPDFHPAAEALTHFKVIHGPANNPASGT